MILIATDRTVVEAVALVRMLHEGESSPVVRALNGRICRLAVERLGGFIGTAKLETAITEAQNRFRLMLKAGKELS